MGEAQRARVAAFWDWYAAVRQARWERTPAPRADALLLPPCFRRRPRGVQQQRRMRRVKCAPPHRACQKLPATS